MAIAHRQLPTLNPAVASVLTVLAEFGNQAAACATARLTSALHCLESTLSTFQRDSSPMRH
jgi:hypothetical protein